MITKEEFDDYESIRSSGITNMFDVKRVCSLSQRLTRDKCIEIMSTYTELKQKYGDTNE